MSEGASNIIIFGAAPAVTTSYVNVWGLSSGGSYVQLTSGVAMEVLSSSANDASAGTGARTIKIVGLDGNYAQFSETVTLNGVTPVSLVKTSVIAINSITVLTAGSAGTNQGRIDVRTISGSIVKSCVRSAADSAGLSHDFIYTVPAGFYAKLKRCEVFIAGVTAGYISATIRSYTAAGAYNSNGVITNSFDVAGFSGSPFALNYGSDGLFFPSKTLITLMAIMSTGTASVSAIGELELYKA